jgi:hypothetical protein
VSAEMQKMSFPGLDLSRPSLVYKTIFNNNNKKLESSGQVQFKTNYNCAKQNKFPLRQVLVLFGL